MEVGKRRPMNNRSLLAHFLGQVCGSFQDNVNANVYDVYDLCTKHFGSPTVK